MNTLIIRETTRMLASLILVFSVFVLMRGHDHPGGGFSGGLIASISFCLYVFAFDAQTVRRTLRVDPRYIAASGLVLAIGSSFVGLAVRGAPFLSGQWVTIAGQKIGTPLVFDVGVYLVVIGTVMTFVLGIKER